MRPGTEKEDVSTIHPLGKTKAETRPSDVQQLAVQMRKTLDLQTEQTVDPAFPCVPRSEQREQAAKNSRMFAIPEDHLVHSIEPVRVQERRNKLLNKFSPASYLRRLEKRREERRRIGFDARMSEHRQLTEKAPVQN
jgi:hypothetical protein